MEKIFLESLESCEFYDFFKNKFIKDIEFRRSYLQRFHTFTEKFVLNSEEELKKDHLIDLALSTLSELYIYNPEQNHFYSLESLSLISDDNIIFHLRDIIIRTDDVKYVATKILLFLWKTIKNTLKQRTNWNVCSFQLNHTKKNQILTIVNDFFSGSHFTNYIMYLIGQFIRKKDLTDLTEITIYDHTSDSANCFLQFLYGILYKFVSKKAIYQSKIINPWKDNYSNQFTDIYYISFSKDISFTKIQELCEKELEFAFLISCINYYDSIVENGTFGKIFSNCHIRNIIIHENVSDFNSFQRLLFLQYARKTNLLCSNLNENNILVNNSSSSNNIDSKCQVFLKLKEICADFCNYIKSFGLPTKIINSVEVIKKIIISEGIQHKYSYYSVTPFDLHLLSCDFKNITSFIHDNCIFSNEIVTDDTIIESEYFVIKLLLNKLNNSYEELSIKVFELFYRKIIEDQKKGYSYLIIKNDTIACII